ncbi:MAG: hypothetical protein LC104_00895 [Bacteroidales bacterium]|nr:hypothetical protein [Bacteroidales bacterium]
MAAPACAAEATATETAHLTQLLRGLLLANLPDPVTKTYKGWGHQKETLSGLKWHRDGLRLRAEPQRSFRNDGHWQAARIEAINPEHTLLLGINQLQYPTPGTATFNAYVGLDVRLTYEQQLWKAGARLYGGETRAKCKAAILLHCEVTNRLERRPGATLPDAVFRVRVTQAELFYSGLVCEHTLGMGGDAARLLGEAIHKFLTEVKPSVERDLLAKANAAIVKAADTREVRIEFDKLLQGQTPSVTRTKK